MRLVYRVLGFAILALTALQAASHSWASAGMGVFVNNGGVIDLSLMSEQGGPLPFPEVMGFMIHGLNGMFVIPLASLALLVVSFFAKFRGAVLWAAVVVVLVALQVTLGLLGHGLALLGFLHGMNALILGIVVFYAALRAGSTQGPNAGVANERTRADTSV